MKTRRSKNAKHPSWTTLNKVLPQVLRNVKKARDSGASELNAVWAHVVPRRYFPYTKILRLQNGVLEVSVTKALVLQQLFMEDQGKMLYEIKKQLPKLCIQKIRFQRSEKV